jgi:putative RNA 2'-phosphotransferase
MKTLTDYRLSEFLSLILRHRPETIQLTLDDYGYAKIEDIISRSKENGYVITEDELNKVVFRSDKKRFTITGDKIKAIQGHSFEILIEEKSQKPPVLLYHGTKVKLKDKITQQGLLGMRRSMVQLYSDYSAAYMHNIEPLVFEIDAGKMYNDGFEFYLYDGVWQTKTVPANYLTVKELHEIEQLKKVTVTKHTFYSKLINAEIKLEARFNAEPWIYVNDCFLCGCKRTRYSVDKKIVRCDEMTYERPAKRHNLPGKFISFEQLQTEREIEVKQVFEIGIKKDKELQIGNDLLYQGIGIRFYCPACNERDFISNMTKSGEEYKCRSCNIDLFRIDKPTEITLVTSAWQ